MLIERRLIYNPALLGLSLDLDSNRRVKNHSKGYLYKTICEQKVVIVETSRNWSGQWLFPKVMQGGSFVARRLGIPKKVRKKKARAVVSAYLWPASLL